MFVFWTPGWETPVTLGMCEPDCLGSHGGGWLPPWRAQQWLQNSVYNCENKQQLSCLLQCGFNTCTVDLFTVSLHSHLHLTEKFSPAQPKHTSTLLNQTTFFRCSEARITYTLETPSVDRSLTILGLKISFGVYPMLHLFWSVFSQKNTPLNICLLISIVIKKVLAQYFLNMQTSWRVGFCLFTPCHYSPAFVSQLWHSATDLGAEL